MLLVPQTAATTWRVLCAFVCLLFFLNKYSSGAFLLFSSLFQVVLLTCLPHTLRGGGARQFDFSIFSFFFAFDLTSLFRIFHVSFRFSN